MPDRVDATSNPYELLPRDEGLRCLACGYNLTGLADERCPECGEVFDPEALRAALSGRTAPVPGWDDGSASWPVAFVNTCLLTWISPTRFGRQFPARHVRRYGMLFRIISLAAALAVYSIVCVLVRAANGTLGPDWLMTIVIPPGVMVGALLCEVMLASVFTATMRRACLGPSAGGLGRFVSWRGLVGFFRSFLIVSAVLITPWYALLSSVPGPDTQDLLVLLWASIIVAILLWWHNLMRAAMAASLPGPGRIIACLAVPVAAVAAIFIGFVTSFICGLFLFGFFQR
jgi:hypothetical protein